MNLIKNLVTGLFVSACIAQAGTDTGVKVGKVVVSSTHAGLHKFQKENNATWTGNCLYNNMYADLTKLDALNGLLSILLTAKSTGQTVTVDYSGGGGSDCTIIAVTLE